MPDGNDKGDKEDLQKELRDKVGAVDKKGIWGVIKKAIQKLICLEIKTIVIDGAEKEVISTEIDLLQADRKNEINRKFLNNPELAGLREFHAEQVKLAEQDIQKKLEFLQKLAETLIHVIDQEKKQE
jgi:hypothetical protein